MSFSPLPSLTFDPPSLLYGHLSTPTHWGASFSSDPLAESQLVSSSSLIGESSKLSECARPSVYYRVISKNGSRRCKQPADERDPFLGRLEAEHIAPPQTVASVIECICGIEGVANHRDTKLVSPASGAPAMCREEPMEVLSGGSDPLLPLVLVLVDQSDAHNKLIVAKYCSYWAYGEVDPKWMSFKKGEILFTDGIVRSDDNGTVLGNSAYRAQKPNGEIGFVCVCDFSGPS